MTKKQLKETENKYFKALKEEEIKKPLTCFWCKQTKEETAWFKDLYKWAIRDASHICANCITERIKQLAEQEEGGKDILGRIAKGRAVQGIVKNRNLKADVSKTEIPNHKIIDSPEMEKSLEDITERLPKGSVMFTSDENYEVKKQKKPIILFDEFEIACSCSENKGKYVSRYECDKCTPWQGDIIPTVENLKKGVVSLKEAERKVGLDQRELKAILWEKITLLENKIIDKEKVPQNDPTKCSYCEGELYYVVKEVYEREPLIGLCETHQRDNQFCATWVCTPARSYSFYKVINGKWQPN